MDNRGIRNRIGFSALVAILGISGLLAKPYVTKCFQGIRIDRTQCVAEFLQHADFEKKSLYYLCMIGGIIFSVAALYLFYKIKTNPEALAYLKRKLTQEEQLKKQKIVGWSFLLGIIIFLFILLFARHYVRL